MNAPFEVNIYPDSMIQSYPRLRLEKDTVLRNIERMAQKAKIAKVEFRPHFKTHQSHLIGSWFRDFGVTGITVSSLKMAEFFERDGWDDITVAFPVNFLEIDRINRLAKKIQLNLLITDPEMLQLLHGKLSTSINCFIEIDPNYGRSGIGISDFSRIELLISKLSEIKNLRFIGFYSHAGQTYKCENRLEVKELSSSIIYHLDKLKTYFGGTICFGDTPSCSVLDHFGSVDQISPGNFVFFDWMQHKIGSCTVEDIGVIMECPVVAKFEDRSEILIHSGAVHFSKEYVLNRDGSRNFGQVRDSNDQLSESNFVRSISQEHGIVACSTDFFRKIKVGDILQVYPIHSCLTANLMGAYITENDEIIHQFRSGAPYTD